MTMLADDLTQTINTAQQAFVESTYTLTREDPRMQALQEALDTIKACPKLKEIPRKSVVYILSDWSLIEVYYDDESALYWARVYGEGPGSDFEMPPAEIIEKTCICGTTFSAERFGASFCSAACSDRWFREGGLPEPPTT